MKLRILFFTLALTVLFQINVCRPNGEAPVARIEYPTVNLPVELRQDNWQGLVKNKKGEYPGSCVFACLVDLLRWQGQLEMSDHIRQTYSGGTWADASFNPERNLVQIMDAEGIRYDYTVDADVEFLERACLTRRGCAVSVTGGKHMVVLVYLDDEWAGLLDSNDNSKIIYVPREKFLSEWRNSIGWAVTPVYTPLPPMP